MRAEAFSQLTSLLRGLSGDGKISQKNGQEQGNEELETKSWENAELSDENEFNIDPDEIDEGYRP